MGQKTHPHGVRVGIIKGWDSKWYANKKEFGDNLVEDNNALRAELAEAQEILDKMIERFHLKDAGTAEQIALLNKIFALPEFEFDTNHERAVKTVVYDKLIPALRAVEYMNDKFSDKIHCEDLLRVSGFCRTDFYKMIKKTVGETYSIYLQKVRVKRAHRALGFSEYSFLGTPDAAMTLSLSQITTFKPQLLFNTSA